MLTHRPASPVPGCWGSCFLNPEPSSGPAAQAGSPENPHRPQGLQACTQPTPSSLQFPSPQIQNQMQALDKRYPPTLVAEALAGGKGALGEQCLVLDSPGYFPS